LAVTLYYPSALFFINPIARPDSVGTMLFLAAIAAPWLASFSYRGIAASAFLAALAFLTKPYFAIAFVIVSTYLFLFNSIWRSIAFIAISIAILGVTFIVVTSLLPTYFYEIVLSNFYLVGPYLVQHMTLQVDDYMQLYWSLLVSLLGLALLGVVRWSRSCSNDRPRWHLSPTAGLLPVKMDYFLFAALVSFLACVYPLGGNNGAYLTYFFQLITPCLAVAVARMLDRVDLGVAGPGTNVTSDAVRISICLLLCANIVTLLRWTDASFDWDKSAAAWKKIEIVLSGYQNVLSVPALAATLIRQQKPVYDSGITGTFHFIPTEKMPRDLALRTIAWRQDIYTQIAERKFDLIVSDRTGMPAFANEELVHKHYEKAETSTVYMPTGQQWILQFWTPRKSSTDR